MNPNLHHSPDRADIEANKEKEPEGERLRAELEAWITKNGIVGMLMDTAEHIVDMRIVKLPPRIKPVLTLWGSIYVRDDQGSGAASKDQEKLHRLLEEQER